MSQVRFWDFTLNNPTCSAKDVRMFLRQLAVNWTFQEEKVSTRHFQGRFKLRKPKKELEVVSLLKGGPLQGAHVSMTSTNGSRTFNYTMKIESRTDGPWNEKDAEEIPLPRQLQGINQALWPWQQKIWDSCAVFNERQINIIYDPHGNIGKSTICQYMDYKKRAMRIPPLTDFKECIQMVMGKGASQAYTIDMPRAMKKDRLGEFWTFIEQLKSGHVWDTRYNYREMWMDSPTIWVFTNTLPNFELLSRDRWVLWEVRDKDLVPYIVTAAPSDDFVMPPPKRIKLSLLEGGGL